VVDLSGAHYESPTRARQAYHKENMAHHTTPKQGKCVTPGGFMDNTQIRDWSR
jgi:hypothetical protein